MYDTLYVFYEDNRSYRGYYTPQHNPANPDSLIYRPFSTDTPPPKFGIKKIPVFFGSIPEGGRIYKGGWELRDDFRGEKWYSVVDGKEVTIDYIGPIKDGYTDKPRPSDLYDWSGDEWVLNKERNKNRVLDRERAWRNSVLSLSDKCMLPDFGAVGLDGKDRDRQIDLATKFRNELKVYPNETDFDVLIEEGREEEKRPEWPEGLPKPV